MPESGGLGRAVQLFAQRVLGHAAAVVGEQELGGPCVSRVAQGTPGRSDLCDAVDQGERFVVERRHPLAVELAEWCHLQQVRCCALAVHLALKEDDVHPASVTRRGAVIT
jgi:hypothetical protein